MHQKIEKKTKLDIQMEVLAAVWKRRWRRGREKPGIGARCGGQHSTPPQGRQAAPRGRGGGREGEELQKRAKKPRVSTKVGPGYAECLEERKVARTKGGENCASLDDFRKAGRASPNSCRCMAVSGAHYARNRRTHLCHPTMSEFTE